MSRDDAVNALAEGVAEAVAEHPREQVVAVFVEVEADAA